MYFNINMVLICRYSNTVPDPSACAATPDKTQGFDNVKRPNTPKTD
jgi:hypothetical protein